MDSGLYWQYGIVLLIVVGALVKIIIGLRKSRRKKTYGSCCGCALAESCRDFSERKKSNSLANPPKAEGSNTPEPTLKDCNRK